MLIVNLDPFRFKEDVGDVAALREKEMGDWKKMTKEEKKALYRQGFDIFDIGILHAERNFGLFYIGSTEPSQT